MASSLSQAPAAFLLRAGTLFFQKIQDAGKNVYIAIEPEEMDVFMDAMRPEGVMLHTWAPSVEEADRLVAKTLTWRGTRQ